MPNSHKDCLNSVILDILKPFRIADQISHGIYLNYLKRRSLLSKDMGIMASVYLHDHKKNNFPLFLTWNKVFVSVNQHNNYIYTKYV